jgi:SAM-dependent methyltransferase
LRSDPIINLDFSYLYSESTFDYESELKGLGETYSRIVLKACQPDNLKCGILEIGGGNGFFLEEMYKCGFDKLLEIEPSNDAKKKALPHISANFITSMFDEKIKLNQEFGLIATFHVLDHLRKPSDFMSVTHRNLRSGGEIAVAVHNSRSWSAKIFKNRSPIFDVEHTYLYDKKTLKLLLEKSGFQNVYVKSYWNSYSLAYLLQLLPISRRFRIMIKNSKANSLLTKVQLRVPLGNIVGFGTK